MNPNASKTLSIRPAASYMAVLVVVALCFTFTPAAAARVSSLSDSLSVAAPQVAHSASVSAPDLFGAVERTTLYVNIAVERQEIIAGPYARYAQKFLGTTAPLTDKVLHEVVSVKLLDVSDVAYVVDRVVENGRPSHMNPETGFPRLTVDKHSAASLSQNLEESARTAAGRIFEIRNVRFELISGEVSENVFGGGLGSALDELDRLEEEYLSLFFGRRTVRIDTRQYRVIPSRERATYTVCRFSESDGLLPEDDLSGVPVVMELKAVDGTGSAENGGGQSEQVARPRGRSVPKVVPADVQCRIILEGVELASDVFQINQLGKTVYVKK